MSSLEDHCRESTRLFGKPHAEVHQWLDEFAGSPQYGYNAISSYHPFVDGNKRTALVASDVCLRLNGYRLTDSDDVESFFWSIARGEQTVDDIESWVKNRAKPLIARN